MTGTADKRKRRTDQRAERYRARTVLREESSLRRVRACGLNGTPNADGVASITVKVTETPDGVRAGLAGLSVCGNTWACPVCSEKIQTERAAELRYALDQAAAMGLVAVFLTFTVRHRRGHALHNVWAAVAGAWRAATAGAGPAWERDRDHYGVEGYIRLSETTYGDDNGWHSHIHALVLLDPAGRRRMVKTDLIGPLPAPKSRPVPLDLQTVVPLGPPTLVDATSGAEQVKQRYCPWTPPYRAPKPSVWRSETSKLTVWRESDVAWLGGVDRRPQVEARTTGGRTHTPRVSAMRCETAQRLLGLVPDSRSMAALVNDAYDERRRRYQRSGNPATRAHANAGDRRGIFLRDARALGDRMFARWRSHLAGLVCTDDGEKCTRRQCARDRKAGRPACGKSLGYEPDDVHGLDVQLVEDPAAFSAEYFAKHQYGVKDRDSAAFDLTGSHAKQARRGNTTPFGILARIVDHAEQIDPETGEIRRLSDPRDLRLWMEWERASKGRRQLLWSNGLRTYLGMEERSATDEEIAEGGLDGQPVLALDPAGFRRVERAGAVPKLLAMVEAGDLAGAMFWLSSIGVHCWRPGHEPPQLAAA